MTIICCILMVLAGLTTVRADAGMTDYFRLYYEQLVAGGRYQGPLPFLQTASASSLDVPAVLKTGQSRKITIDPGNGSLQIKDSSDTDQELTMALYRKADRGLLLVVGSSECDDACEFSVEIFNPSGDHLQPVALEDVIPTIDPKEFIKPGHPMPPRLASLRPSINYVPARVGTTLTLTPWYGYEVEESMNAATRASIRRTLVLNWDAKRGRFVRP